jgi:restriction system protein
MARRTTKQSADEGRAGIAFLFLFGLASLYRWVEALPVPWKIASSVLAISAILLLAWSFTSLIRKRYRRRLLEKELLDLNPTQFEERVQLLLADLGWTELQRRGGSGDRGVDLVGECEGLRYVVQCKRYTKRVPPAMVRDLVGALHIQKADRALLVTTSGFTKQGHAEVRDQHVELWDGDILAAQIARAAALRADPLRVRAARRRTGAIVYAGMLLNSVLVAWAFAAVGPPPLSAPPVGARDSRPPAPTPMLSATPSLAPTTAPTAQPTPSAVPVAAVFNGGNVRAAPALQATVRDQVNAGETVALLGRSPDRQWIQVRDARGQVGWVHRTLLTIDPAIDAALAVSAP